MTLPIKENPEIIEQAQDNQSVQPRFSESEAMRYARTFINLALDFDAELPRYGSDTRKRDKALQSFWRNESLISGVISSVVERDKNRAWNITGGRNQVRRYKNLLDNLHGNSGWRHFISLNSLAYYTSSMGFVSEIEYEKRSLTSMTPVDLWNMDSTRCAIHNSGTGMLSYYPSTSSKYIKLESHQYLHGVSMPAFDEDMQGHGFSALERALNFVRIMVGINSHTLEKLGVAPPKGFLLMKGITLAEWKTANSMAEELKKDRNLKTYSGIIPLLTKDPNVALELIGLSSLPDYISDIREFVDLIMQVFALSFGYSVSEFWSISSGAFGRDGESSQQGEQATQKGEVGFALLMQDQLQRKFLPESTLFEFDKRNDAQDMAKINVESTYSKMVIDLADSALISVEEGRILLAQKGIIMPEWTESTEEASASDIDAEQQRLLENVHIRQAIDYFPSEPIVTLSNTGHERVIWNTGADAIRRKSFPIGTIEREVLYEDEDNDIQITDDDIDEIINGLQDSDEDDLLIIADLLNASIGDD